ncbi:MAG: phosphotransferase [Leptolyngbya sp. SIO1D8]|nr:phosphotransferase [Leptolyngbya sp. SIO1D8]
MQDFESLTKSDKAQRYRKALTQALDGYPVDVRSLEFISFESKPVYRVETDSGYFAAKFHEPQEHALLQMMGEMQFLDHISRHSELRIETPLANSKGEFVTEIQSIWLPEPAHVALCNWLPGSQLEDSISADSYHHLGKCSALLHKASSSFRPEQEFDILTNNQVFYWDEETILSRQDLELLPKQRQDVFRKGAHLAQKAIEKIWETRQPIVIHNDLNPCNVKMHCGNLYLYDFEDIALGFPEQDIGTTMLYIRFRDDYPELLGAFQEGYEQVLPWPLDSNQQLDCFVMARLLMLANYVVNFNIDPTEHLPQFETELKTLLSA